MSIENHTFDKYIPPNCNILILGSFPSVISRNKNFYYMNKNNRFYKVLAALLDENFLNEDIEIKKELLSKYHIGLFDVIKECEITNSSDSTIKNVIYNDIYNIVKENNIKHIFLNGKKAYELFQNNFSELLNIATYLPSTSSANASFSLEKLISYYSVILTYNNWW